MKKYTQDFPFRINRASDFFFERERFLKDEEKRRPSFRRPTKQDWRIPLKPNNSDTWAHTGIATHLAIRCILEGESPSKLFEREEVLRPISEADLSLAKTLTRTFFGAFGEMKSRGYSWVASEVSVLGFGLPLMSNRPSERWYYTGVADLVLRNPEGVLEVWDIKTTRRPSKLVTKDTALSLYLYATLLSQHYGETVEVGGVFVLSNTSNTWSGPHKVVHRITSKQAKELLTSARQSLS